MIKPQVAGDLESVLPDLEAESYSLDQIAREKDKVLIDYVPKRGVRLLIKQRINQYLRR